MNRTLRAAAAALWISVCLCSIPTYSFAQSLQSPWSNADVGAPSLSGRAAASAGTVSIEAGGVDIWDTRDEFHFVYQRVSGDFDLRARLDSLRHAHWWSKAGVMVRATLDAGSPHAFSMVSGESGTGFQRRRTANAESLHTPGPFVTAPYWVRLVRRASTLTAYTSSDGSGWQVIDSDSVTLPDSVYVGLALTSHEPSVRASASFSSLTLTPVGSSSTGLSHADIGAPAIAGGFTQASGAYVVTAAGRDIWDTADQFHFVYQPMTGDLDITARVASLMNTDIWAKAGIMVRESLAAGSRHALAAITPENGYAFQRRAETDGLSDHSYAGAGTAPGWVRLVRRGSVFESFRSADGAAWTSMGTATVAMAETVFVGLAVTSHNESVATVATIDSFRAATAGASGNKPPAVAVTTPANGAQLQTGVTLTMSASASDPDGSVARVEFLADGAVIGTDTTAPYSVQIPTLASGSHTLTAIAVDNTGATTLSAPVNVSVAAPAGLPSGFLSGDVGAPAVAGSASHSSGIYTVSGAGRDIWDAEDQFHFVYQTVSGDVDVRARLRSLQWTDIWAKAGVMIRESLAAGSRHAFAAITPDRGYAFQRRTSTGGTSENASMDGAAPGWIRLTRKGSSIEAFLSPDGVTWTTMGTATVPFGQSVLVGLAVTSHNEAQATTAVLDNLAITPVVASANQPPVVSITSPANGASVAARSVVTITAAASDPDGTVRSVTIYANGTALGTRTAAPYSVTTDPLVAGSYTLTASATDDKGLTTTSTGISITAGSLESTAPRAVTFTVSADHATLVSSYLLEVFAASATPGTSAPLAQLNLGKPTPDGSGDASVDCSAFFQALTPGSYLATVSAIGAGGTARGAAVAFTR